ncbi:hypothetical protein [Succinimonas amylolytica]|uniref:hypothetical protein n=1 Tax=Succinimonas amylolytica TaxID=83769 RepID=UPI00036F9C80|nr:hypothetical protein [Succinimonas amylolytica]
MSEENRHDQDERDSNNNNISADNEESLGFDSGNPENPANPGSPDGMRFEFRVNVPESELDRMAGAHRAAAIRTAVISAVLLMTTVILPSFSDEEMTFPAAMLFWFVLVLTATRTIVSIKDFLQDREYFVQNVVISSLLSPPDEAGDGTGADGNPERSAALREVRLKFLETFRIRFLKTRIFHFMIMLLAVSGTAYFGNFIIRNGFSSLSSLKSILVALSFTLLFLLAMRTMYLSCILTREAFFRMATSSMTIRSGKNSEF